MYSVASEDDIVFINETYNENIDRLHGVQRNVAVWKELLRDKDSTYYVVNAEAPVACAVTFIFSIFVFQILAIAPPKG